MFRAKPCEKQAGILDLICCCGEYYDPRNLGEERFYFILQIIIDHREKSGHECKQELKAGSMEECCSQFPVRFLIQPRLLLGG